MQYPIYQVDAFACKRFRGNPAAVIPTREPLPADLMQAIAAENNLSETAFVVPTGDAFSLRWFTPVTEVDLCGHATLATAFVLFEFGMVTGDRIEFKTLSGSLATFREGNMLRLDFPAKPPQTLGDAPDLTSILGARPRPKCCRPMTCLLFSIARRTLPVYNPILRQWRSFMPKRYW